MDVAFSRHAKRRLQLYSIDEEDVIEALERGLKTVKVIGSRGILIDQASAGKYLYPLKIVFVLDQDRPIVVTAYPLKKGVTK